MKIFEFLFGKKITQADIDAGIKAIKEEQKYKRMYVIHPPLSVWSKPKLDKKGYVIELGKIQTNQKYIDKWKKEHFDWMPDKF